ncbi:MAG: hypothetical protein R3B13_03965 [Polyangiaceae bacterium]
MTSRVLDREQIHWGFPWSARRRGEVTLTPSEALTVYELHEVARGRAPE